VARALLLGVIGLALFGPGAWAADWSIKSTLSESLEISDNHHLETNPLGPSYNTYSSLFVDVLGQTPTSRFETFGNLKYRDYNGPGEAGQLNAWDKNITARYEKSQKLTTYNAFASYSEVQTSAIQLVETGFTTLAGSTITKTAGGGLKHNFSATESLDFNTIWNSTDFTEPGSNRFSSWTTTADWRHRISPLTDLTPTVRFQWLKYDDPAQTNVLFTIATLDLRSQLTQLLSFYATAGAAYANASNNGLVLGSSNPAGLSGGSATDWVASATLNYQWTRSLNAILTAARVIGPTTLGQFQASDQISGSVIYTINPLSHISLTQAFSHISSSGGASGYDLLSTTVGYNYRLAREWNARLSYQYIQRDSDTSPARSNTVLMTITKDFTVLPP
jgi:hypothetical protein